MSGSWSEATAHNGNPIGPLFHHIHFEVLLPGNLDHVPGSTVLLALLREGYQCIGHLRHLLVPDDACRLAILSPISRMSIEFQSTLTGILLTEAVRTLSMSADDDDVVLLILQLLPEDAVAVLFQLLVVAELPAACYDHPVVFISLVFTTYKFTKE